MMLKICPRKLHGKVSVSIMSDFKMGCYTLAHPRALLCTQVSLRHNPSPGAGPHSYNAQNKSNDKVSVSTMNGCKTRCCTLAHPRALPCNQVNPGPNPPTSQGPESRSMDTQNNSGSVQDKTCNCQHHKRMTETGLILDCNLDCNVGALLCGRAPEALPWGRAPEALPCGRALKSCTTAPASTAL